MASRAPSVPPVLPGFAYKYPLGVGGFADVFLYEQDRPHRDVAVKVLLQSLVDPDVLRRFNAEADAMAALGAHPSVVSVHAAGISADGRPYLVMEHCPGPLIRRDGRGVSDPLPVDRVLAIGVRMASALETAHRAGVLHRDVKPSNILVSVYGTPALSDFGIAASLTGTGEPIWAMSVPWTAPEVLAEKTSGTVASEVWALAATLYTLLAGHAPFETGDPATDTRDKQRARIIRGRALALPPGVPGPAAGVVESALQRNPPDRPTSMLAFARELQAAQQVLGLAVTALELPREIWGPEVDPAAFADDELRGAVIAAVPVESRRRRRWFGKA
ncbi:serine/threonine-protein kinase [Gryllotalpicola sp.]|uniref:serine/threonine-protein kinase n=1 Tax=Gryllotalpicola sp. TaxID=1932787 RepID=UPI002602E9E5|nr:serine/threonine-protein kinase [Gryllotalpicola sp.]